MDDADDAGQDLKSGALVLPWADFGSAWRLCSRNGVGLPREFEASSPAVLSTVSADRNTKMQPHSLSQGTAIVDKCKSYCIAMRLGPTPVGADPESAVLGDGGRPGP